jgi:hypothetical protein
MTHLLISSELGSTVPIPEGTTHPLQNTEEVPGCVENLNKTGFDEMGAVISKEGLVRPAFGVTLLSFFPHC